MDIRFCKEETTAKVKWTWKEKIIDKFGNKGIKNQPDIEKFTGRSLTEFKWIWMRKWFHMAYIDVTISCLP